VFLLADETMSGSISSRLLDKKLKRADSRKKTAIHN